MKYDCVVIGAGPGGLVAALYLRRLQRKVLLIDGGPPRAEKIPRIRNLVGYAEGISGKTLLKRLRYQYAKYEGETLCARASVHRRGGGFVVHADDREILTRKVILATGMRDVEPPFGNVPDLTQKGLIGYCPICDGFDHREDKLALLMNDPHALKKVRFMKGFSDDLVVILMRKMKLQPSHRKLLKAEGVPLIQGPPRAIRESRDGLVFDFKTKKLKVGAAYVMMGTEVPCDATNGMRGLRRTRDGFLIVNSHQETSVKGLYGVGDCVNALSQVSVAVGHAAIAATHVHNSL